MLIQCIYCHNIVLLSQTQLVNIKFYIDVHKDHTASTDNELTLKYSNVETLTVALKITGCT